ncbi:hypothetical protein [Pinibacter soli]|uniref:DUF4348 domain-containing protein n=1 Tax=Pinibacter soli TaxID=3044211 RepID=A0ABT6RFG6_9BACT|nr:hypothetical protein [Pinibacter soli]MDI3321308.1 hypothetical protein [Pinibacter soli]
MTFLNSFLKTFCVGLIVIVVASCNEAANSGNDKIDHADSMKKVATQVEKIVAISDTLIIDQTCAVIVTADSSQIAKRKKELGQDFYVGEDDYAFYLNETQTFLDSVKLKIIDCNGKKVLKFIYGDKKQELINLTKLDELWKVYLFDPKRKSKSVDMTMIDEEYKDYFK